jgi:hypothetical protein
VDFVWEQKKLEARKMLEKPHHTHLSSARFVGRFYGRKTHCLKRDGLNPYSLACRRIRIA